MSCNLEQALNTVRELLKLPAIQNNIPFEIKRIKFEIEAMMAAKKRMLEGPTDETYTTEKVEIDHGTDYTKLITSLENRVKDYVKYVTKDTKNINVHRSTKDANGQTKYLPFGNPFSRYTTGEVDDSILSAMFYRWVVNNEVPASFLSEESTDTRANRLGGINSARRKIIDELKNIAGKELYYEGTARGKNLSHASTLALIADLYNKGTLTIDINSKQNVLKASGVEVKPSKETTYEVSSKGDKDYSALYAKLEDGRSIEEHYQVDVKGYKTWRDGKGKPPKDTSKNLQEEYTKLWKRYFGINPDKYEFIKEKVNNGVKLTDQFATKNSVNQADTIMQIVNSKWEPKKRVDTEDKTTKITVIPSKGLDMQGVQKALNEVFKNYIGKHNHVKTANGRRDAIWFGPKDYEYSNVTHKSDTEVPAVIKKLARKAEELSEVESGYFNSVLINRYSSNKGLTPHRDDEDIFRDSDGNIGKITSMSIIGTADIIIRDNKSNIIEKHTVKEGDVYIMPDGKFQDNFTHQVVGKEGERISLTFRHVPNTEEISNEDLSVPPPSSKLDDEDEKYRLIEENNLNAEYTNDKMFTVEDTTNLESNQILVSSKSGKGIYTIPGESSLAKLKDSIDKLLYEAEKNGSKEYLITDLGTKYTDEELVDMLFKVNNEMSDGAIPDNVKLPVKWKDIYFGKVAKDLGVTIKGLEPIKDKKIEKTEVGKSGIEGLKSQQGDAAVNSKEDLDKYTVNGAELAIDEYLAPDSTPEASTKSEDSIIPNKAPDTEHKVTISELMRCLNSYKG